MNRIFYIMGKSSSGKDTIYKKILDDLQLNPLVLCTTRPMRENEQQGREYNFVDREYFNHLVLENKVIEKRIYNTVYGEWIYFTAEESVDLSKGNYLGIGTLESYIKMRDYFGAEKVIPIYIEVEDGLRLTRAIQREKNEKQPKYTELCRRFIADSNDFSEENLAAAGIEKRFDNGRDIEDCIFKIKNYIKQYK